MSAPDWSWEDVELLSTLCQRIAGYSDHLEPHLHGLLDKYQDLGGKLHHLSSRLKISSTRYYDCGLEDHLHETLQELQARRNTHNAPRAGFMGRVRILRRNNEFTTHKIRQLHFDVDKYIYIAERFRTDFLFAYASPKLEYIVQKFVDQVPRQSSKTSTTETSSTDANRPDLIFSNIPSSPNTPLSIGKRDAKTPVDAPLVISIARMLWETRATMLDHDQARSRREHSSRASPAIPSKDFNTLAKEKYLDAVLSLMEETPLDELCAPSGQPSPEFLDRLAAIVAQAAELVKVDSPPDLDAHQSTAQASSSQTQPWTASRPPEADPAYQAGVSQFPTPPQTEGSPNSPQAIGQSHTIPRKPLRQESRPLSPPISRATSSADRIPEPTAPSGSRQVIGHSGPTNGPAFSGLGPPAMSSSESGFPSRRDADRVIPSAHSSAVARGKRPARGNNVTTEQNSIPSSWTQVSCLEAGIIPSFCTLRIASFNDKHFLLAAVTTNFSPVLMANGYSGRTLGSSPPIYHMDRTHRSSSLSDDQIYEHLILPDARPMASVLHPDYEGPVQNPGRPYTLSFKELQSLCEYTLNPRPQLVSDLEYIFSDKAERDLIRSSLFGKQLRLHAGVESIKFDYIACLKGAISLWEESVSKPLTISFNRKSQKSKDRPDGEVEYQLVHLTSRGRALKDPLTLTVRQIAGPGTREVTSKITECRLYFTRSDEKDAFMSILEPPQHRPGP